MGQGGFHGAGRKRACAALLAVVCLGVVAAGAFARGTGPDPAVKQYPDWPHKTVCGVIPFDPAEAFSSPATAESRQGGLFKALRRFLRLHAGEVSVPRTHWRLIARNKRAAEFTSGSLVNEPAWLLFERLHGRWSWQSSGECRPVSLRHGLAAAEIYLPDHPKPITPETTSLRVMVLEGGCTGGANPNKRLQKPEIRYTDDAVIVSLWARPLPPGAYTCPLITPPPITIDLPEPVGDRVVLDGGTYPPQELGPLF